MGMNAKQIIVVDLDKNSLASGVVLARPDSMKDALQIVFGGRDGARMSNLRIWQGDFALGKRVTL